MCTCLVVSWFVACAPDVAPGDDAEVDMREAISDTPDDSADVTPDTDDGGAAEIDAAPTFRPLVDPAAWSHAPDGADPWRAERPAGVVCDAAGIFTEAGTLEIDTDLCNWPTLTQPLLAAVAPDDQVEVVFFFGPLIAPEPAQALVELRLSGDTLWRATFPIPSEGGFVIEKVTPPRAYAAGEAVLFHLHNHGANTWNLASVGILGAPGSE